MIPLLVLACSSPSPDSGSRDSGAGGPDADRTVALTLSADTAVATVSERFLSFAVDSGQVAGTTFWNPDPDADETEIAVDPYDFSRVRLRNLTAELSPAVLRIGGTAADRLWVDLSDDPVTEHEGAEGVLTAAHWAGLMDFATALDLQVLFTLSAGPVQRDEDGVWLDDNARGLLAHAGGRGDPVLGWELANEPNAFALFYGQSYPPEQYAADLQRARAAIDELTPGALLAGPASAFWPVTGEFVEYTEPVLSLADGALDVVTWHFYPQQSDRCPVASRAATPETMLDPAALDEVATWAAVVDAARDQHDPSAQVWLGETGNAQCGGQPGVSDGFASTFWWVDQLGLLAHRGQQVVARQTLSGADYALVDEQTLEPNPDWWASVLWKRTMGRTVLDVQSDDDTLRAWAHCGVDGGVSLALVNVAGTSAALTLDGAGDATAWVMDADDLSSRTVRIDGVVATVDADGVPMALPGQAVRLDRLVLPARSVAFVALPELDAAACSG